MHVRSLLIAVAAFAVSMSPARAFGPWPDDVIAKFDTGLSAPPVPGAGAQNAEPGDMAIMEPYIGTFRGSELTFDDGITKYYFTVEYAWFDNAKTIVKYKVSMVIPSKDRVITNSEGFYGFDPFSHTIYIFGAFRSGMTGWGSMGSFDHETKAREIWATSMRPDGVTMHVRDHFDLLNADSWRNTTRAQENDGEWKVVHQDTYTRVKE